jgi:cystathionine beta-synthase
VFNDAFLAQEGWTGRKNVGTVRDIVINRYNEGSAITVQPGDTVRTAFARMRAADVSQLPVVDDDSVVGLVDESDMLSALLTDSEGSAKVFSHSVKDVMVTRLETISADAPIRDLLPLFRKELVPIVMDGDRFLGLATRMDLINYFRVFQQ